MARESWWCWKEVLAALTISVAGLAIVLDDRSPGWLRAGVYVIAAVGPFLPLLALIPWHFIAKHRGLIPRSRVPCVVSLSDGALHVRRGDTCSSHALGIIVRARYARNANWTESKMLEDALGLFALDGREIERLPGSAANLGGLLVELEARGIPVEDVYVSAPAVLD
jgi:hypothetical protein